MYLDLKQINKSLGRISLLAVPLFFTLSEFFHPKTMDTIIGEIRSAEKYRETWLISHLFALVSIIFIPVLILKMLDLIDRKRMVPAVIFYFISNIGVIGITGLLGYDFLLYEAGLVNNDLVMSRFLSIINSSVYGLIFLKAGPILFLIGFLALGILLLLSEKIKKRVSILILIGTLIYGFAGPLIPVSNGHLIVCFGAAVMLLGFIGIFSYELQKR